MDESTSHSTLFTTLACVALSPGLRSILIFDAPYTGLQQVASLLEPLLAAVSEHPVRRYQLDAGMHEDDTWGNLYLPGQKGNNKPLLFSPERNAHELQLITIADLTRLNLSATRSCLMLIGADVAYLERNGEHQQWHPEQCWLATCESDAVGHISPHLLDRFALRLSWKNFMARPETDLSARSAWLHTHVPQGSSIPAITLPEEYVRLVQQAVQQQPTLAPEVLEYITDNLPSEHYTPRRELALARFAYALARLAKDTPLFSVTEEHVDLAAHIMGLAQDLPSQGLPKTREDRAASKKSTADVTTPTASDRVLAPLLEQPTQKPKWSVLVSEDTVLNPLDMERLCDDPYPEDGAPIEREAASLKFPLARFSPSRSVRGPIVGVEESETLHDLALFSTLLAAAKFQTVRGHVAGEPLRFEPIDLRRYRRGFASAHQLLLILDYTSVRDNASWRDALVPYLHEAYIRRAGISIVKIGAQDSESLLRAELVNEKNISVPRVGEALMMTERGKGYPTPLAHGLQLALEHLRRLFQHGRSTVTHVTLLIVSDGRGNVPLAWSMDNRPGEQIVTREGIDDALTIAEQISNMKRVEALLLYPAESQHPHLPRMLAQRLRAGVIMLPPADENTEAQA
jgi:magnesium chelatase subunit D